MSSNIVIIGGGQSVKQYMTEYNLKDVIANEFVIGCNSAFMDFRCSAVTFLDEIFVSQYKDSLRQQGVVITSKYSHPEKYLNRWYEAEAYRSKLGLTGIYILSLINEIYENENIFLLGYDFYDGNYHQRNKTTQLNTENSKALYHHNNPYELEGKIIQEIFMAIKPKNNIYNVNLNSKIPNYIKINFRQFQSFLCRKSNPIQLEKHLLSKIFLRQNN